MHLILKALHNMLPYKEISQEYPEEFTAAHYIDGLGYGYYWATENLSTVDLCYKIHGTP